MEKAKKRKPKASGINPDMIIKSYRESVLMEGKKPASVFKFCKQIGITESDFYQHFGSFESIEKFIWKSYIIQAKERMDADDNFQQFSAREKILTFYFMLIEMLKEDRSFVLHQLHSVKTPTMVPVFLKDFKSAFGGWVDSVLTEAKGTGEVANRPFLDTRYGSLFWIHFLFILKFWAEDESAGFEKTDAAIEKSVNLAFEVIGKGVLDTALDFGKFMYQQAKG
jgi:hypothetical protein